MIYLLKNKLFLFLTIILFSICTIFSISIYTYHNFSNQFEATKNIINQVHKQDSLLYKQLLISDVASFSDFEKSEQLYTSTSNSQVLQELFNLQKNFNLQQSSIDRFLSLEDIRKEIILLHKYHLENPISNYNFQLQELLNLYEKRQLEVLNSIEYNSNNMKKELILSFFKIHIILIISYIILFIIFKKLIIISKKNSFIENKKTILKNDNFKINNLKSFQNNQFFLDNQTKEIFDFIKIKIENNFHPTIKDIKKEFKLTHPTILSKLKKLEENNLIEFRKDGRNKNIFLK